MSIFDLFRQIETGTTEPAGPPEWIVAGLGNIGERYRGTRHNAGFIMLDAFAESCGAQFRKHQFKSAVAMAKCGETSVLLMKPDTYMNLSGQAVTEAMRFYHIPPERLIVLCDDITQEPGAIRIRKKGSDGGHNGLKNIIYLSGADSFPRIRIGVGEKPHPDFDLADWVLSPFTPEEQEKLRETAKQVCAALPLMLAGKTDEAMNRYNTGKRKKKAAQEGQE